MTNYNMLAVMLLVQCIMYKLWAYYFEGGHLEHAISPVIKVGLLSMVPIFVLLFGAVGASMMGFTGVETTLSTVGMVLLFTVTIPLILGDLVLSLIGGAYSLEHRRRTYGSVAARSPHQ